MLQPLCTCLCALAALLAGSARATTVTVTVTQGCPCAATDTARPCSGGPYVDYYYYEPYTGAPANATHVPTEDAKDDIVAKISQMRDDLTTYLADLDAQTSTTSKAQFLVDNYSHVQFLLQAVSRAANLHDDYVAPANHAAELF